MGKKNLLILTSSNMVGLMTQNSGSVQKGNIILQKTKTRQKFKNNDWRTCLFFANKWHSRVQALYLFVLCLNLAVKALSLNGEGRFKERQPMCCFLMTAPEYEKVFVQQ